MLHPELPNILRHSFDKGVALSVETGVNFNYVPQDTIEALVSFPVERLIISIDGCSQDTYQKYRVGGNYDQVIKNIQTLNSLKDKYKKIKPVLVWQFILFGHNEHEVDCARKTARELEMEFSLKMASESARFQSPVKNKERARKLFQLGDVADRTEYRRKFSREYGQDGACTQLWSNPQVNYDGRVLGCCVNHWGDFGNAFSTSLRDIFFGEKMTYARSMLTGNAPPRDDIPCSQCWMYKSINELNSWVLPVKKPKRSQGFTLTRNQVFFARLVQRLKRIWL